MRRVTGDAGVGHEDLYRTAEDLLGRREGLVDEAVSVTSQVTPCSPSGGTPDRCVITTLSRLAWKARAMARPIPRLPPVTSTLRGSVSATWSLLRMRSWTPSDRRRGVKPRT